MSSDPSVDRTSPNPARRAAAELARQQEAADRAESLGKIRRAGKPLLVCGVVALALRLDAPPRMLLARAFIGTMWCVLPGLVDSHLAVSYGYGLSMLWLSLGLFRPSASAVPTRLLLASVALYGVKVLTFQAARDVRPAYVAKALAPGRERSPRGLSLRRVPFALSVATLLSAFAFPLHAATCTPRIGVAAGAALAAGGLLLQTLADVQKFVRKVAQGADALCIDGLWRISRHPNYLGEIVFQCGLLLAGCSAATSIYSAVLSTLAPTAFIMIMLGATKRLEARQLEAYADRASYRSYVLRVPRLFPRIGRLGAQEKDDAPRTLLRDQSRETVTEQEEQEQLAEEISGIVSVTAAAAWASLAMGVLGAGLLY